jgi:cytochrome P450
MPNDLSSIPIAPRCMPGIGHLGEVMFRPLEFVCSLKKYGSLVRVYLGKTPAVMVNSTKLIHRVLTTEANAFTRGDSHRKAQAFLGNGLGTSDGPLHHRQRRMMQPAFQHDKMDHYFVIMRENTERWVSQLSAGKRLIPEKSLHELVFRIVTNSLIRADLNSHLIDELALSGSILSRGIYWNMLRPDWCNRLPTKGNQRFKEAGLRLRSVSKQIIATYQTTQTDYHDLLSMLIQAKDPETNDSLSLEELIDQIATILVAGSESTTGALTWFFYEIAKLPEIQHRLFHELDQVLAGKAIDAGAISNLGYLRNVIQESLRLYPSAWLLTRQTIREIDFDGFIIPPGTEILVSPYVAHRDPIAFPDPFTFNPDRWTHDNKDLMRSTYIPFANGPHLCIGKHFAMALMSVVIATTLSRWRIMPTRSYRRRPLVGIIMSAPRVPIRLAART